MLMGAKPIALVATPLPQRTPVCGRGIEFVEFVPEKGRESTVVLPLSDYQIQAKNFLLGAEGVAGLFDEPGV